MPGSVVIKDRAIGPGAFLQAMARFVIAIYDGRHSPANILIESKPNYPQIVSEGDFQDLKYENTWPVFF